MSNEAVWRFAIQNAHPNTWWILTWHTGPEEREMVIFMECCGYNPEEETIQFGEPHTAYAFHGMLPDGIRHGKDGAGYMSFREFYDAVWSGQLRQVVEVPRYAATDDDYEVVREALMGFVSERRKVITVQDVLDACPEEFGVNKLLSILYEMRAKQVLVWNEIYINNETEFSFTKRGREVLRDPNRR